MREGRDVFWNGITAHAVYTVSRVQASHPSAAAEARNIRPERGLKLRIKNSHWASCDSRPSCPRAPRAEPVATLTCRPSAWTSPGSTTEPSGCTVRSSSSRAGGIMFKDRKERRRLLLVSAVGEKLSIDFVVVAAHWMFWMSFSHY